MPSPDLPWICPSPYCTEPHNPSSKPVDGVVRCRSCGWERKAAVREPESLDDLPGLFQSIEPKKDDGSS
jgi:hypothetical protein